MIMGTKEAGSMRVCNGVVVLSLYPADDPQSAYVPPVNAAIAHASEVSAQGVLVLAPGNARFLKEWGFAIAKDGSFSPRVVPTRTGKAMPLPRSRTATHRHDGLVWKRSRNSRWSKPLRTRYPVLGFWMEVDGINEAVWVHPAHDGLLVINGEEIEGWAELTDGDCVSYQDSSYVYLREPPGREALADFFSDFTASGWADPLYTRAFMAL